MDDSTKYPEPIAIVGAGCRFPGGASSTSKLWELLVSLRDVQSRMPPSRFNPDGFYHQDGKYHGGTNADRAYVLSEDIRLFDNAFFGIRAQEAESMDPQQRILLEVTYEALEAAGMSIQQLMGSDTAVYVGQLYADYLDLVMRDVDSAPEYTATGTSRSIMSNRLSYFFDWKGPSSTIDTACSSSLVAVHHAVQSLRVGESSMAVAAGVNLLLGPEQFVFESKLKMLSPTGRSRMWDADADGYARGDGFAAVILKTLSRALADGDHIDCIIRETGVNQDGRSMGITMPNPESQAALIRSTYRRCGLDPTSPQDRCQYFEAHGTGTPAGDPVEAEVVQSVFYPREAGSVKKKDSSRLFVGSVKTVIGHTEGTAGLAGLLKASLAVQNAIIPANMHFERPNPAVEVYCEHLEVPVVSKAWPELPENGTRRVSVNSFGFGGTNCHAIVEAWPSPRPKGDAEIALASPAVHCGPFVLSANSPSSLRASINSLSGYLKESHELPLDDLAWVLQSKRSDFPFKQSFVANTSSELVQRLDDWVSSHSEDKKLTSIKRSIYLSSSSHAPAILGVFTGQGAQWPRMGAALLGKSQLFRTTIKALECSLAELEERRPFWSLEAELRAAADVSRIHEAAISQPLCTAVQIALVDLLSSAGVHFTTVVGHSSGEISAAYAAGYLRAADAIRIAYFRGVCTRHASGKGGMLAADMTLHDAREFCQSRKLKGGKLVVAASNAPHSVTLSGDAEAVTEAVVIITKEMGIFARALKVDTAYHSHHMRLCAPEYSKLLEECRIHVLPGSETCAWHSSVHPGQAIDPATLRNSYWIDNMSNPVMFSQAVVASLDTKHKQSHDGVLAVEVGPHAALKKPVADTVEGIGLSIDHHGALRRGRDDMASFCETLGNVWQRFTGSQAVVDFDGFRNACSGEENKASSQRLQVSKLLPKYAWDHGKPLWRESSISNHFRTRSVPAHPVLGSPQYRTGTDFRWRNILKVSEMPWLRGHRLQGQIIFPAQGYVCMAVEGCQALVEQQGDPGATHIRLIELTDVVIHRAITLEDDDLSRAQVFSSFRKVDEGSWQQARRRLVIECTIASGPVDSKAASDIGQDDEPVQNFTCRAAVDLMKKMHDAAHDIDPVLPPRFDHHESLSAVDVADFYSSLSISGLQYSGPFTSQEMKRSRGLGVVRFRRQQEARMRLHPATMDVASHGLLLALSAQPGVKQPTVYLPRSIDRVRIDGHVLYQGRVKDMAPSMHSDAVIADSVLTESGSEHVVGDVDLFRASDLRPEIQIEGLRCSAFGETTGKKKKRAMFSYTSWGKDVLYGLETSQTVTSQDRKEKETRVNRAIRFYMHQLRETVNSEGPHSLPEPHMTKFWQWLMYKDPPVTGHDGRTECEVTNHDTRETLQSWLKEDPECIDMKIVTTLGDNLFRVLHGQASALEVLMEDRMLADWYETGFDCQRAYHCLASALSQTTHKHPRMRILEIGAGPGGATAVILGHDTISWSSYTVTDVSAGFVDEARERFKASSRERNIDFRSLDISRDPSSQGFQHHGYDVLVASNVLFAAGEPSEALRHCRSLLRPGGYLLLVENTCSDSSLHTHFVLGPLPGWWIGAGDLAGHQHSPLRSAAAWDRLLLDSGFSGADSLEKGVHGREHSIIASQAVDDRVAALRNPLDHLLPEELPHIVIISSNSSSNEHPAICKRAQQVHGMLQKFARRVDVVSGIDKFAAEEFPPDAAALCLCELQEPLFRDMSERRFSALQNVLCRASHVLWLAPGGLGGSKIARGESRLDFNFDPHASMVLGITRSLIIELPDRPLQFVSTDREAFPDSQWIAAALLRLVHLGSSNISQAIESGQLLWSNEAEIAVDATGVQLLPRIKKDQDRDDRLNSSTRWGKWASTASHSTQLLLTATKTGSWQLHRPAVGDSPLGHGLERSQNGTMTTVEVRVSYSSLCALRLRRQARNLYLCAGIELSTGRRVVALSSVNASVIIATSNMTFDLPEHVHSMEGLVQQMLRKITGVSLLRRAEEETIWVHGADKALQEVISSDWCRRDGSSAFFSTSNPKNAGPRQTLIHPKMTARRLKAVMPATCTSFLNLEANTHAELGRLITSNLDPKVDVYEWPQLLDDQWTMTTDLEEATLCTVLVDCIQASLLASHAQGRDKRATSVAKMVSEDAEPSDFGLFTVVDWSPFSNSQRIVPVKFDPVDTSKLFSPSKTYLLAGLTGSVGLSICKFMVDNGCRHLAITSRNPSVPESEIAEIERKGGQVKVLQADISDRASLATVRDALDASGLPPVGGVVNGAMVLQDRAFENMTFEGMQAVLRPKVQGTLNLGALFGHLNLEFFILLSSASSVLGVPGLSNYNAGNLYMTAYSQWRRSRGLPASVVDISVLSDSGYLARGAMGSSDDAVQLARRYNASLMSDSDLHVLFAEGILAGRCGLENLDANIHCGIGHWEEDAITSKEKNRPGWFRFPRLSHFLTRTDGRINEPGAHSEASKSSAATTAKDLRTRLSECSGPQESQRIMEDDLSRRLGQMLAMPSGSVDARAPLMTLGIDSLVAVQIRSWLSKELKVDTPVLRILSSPSVAELAAMIIAELGNRDSSKDMHPNDATNLEGLAHVSRVPVTPVIGSSSTPSASDTSQYQSEAPSAEESNPGLQTPTTDSDEGGVENVSIKQAENQLVFSRTGDMSHGQGRLYYQHKYLQDKTTFNCAAAGRIHAPIGVDRLSAALQKLTERHEGLRTCFFIDESTGNSTQGVLRRVNPPLQTKHIRSRAEFQAELDAAMTREFAIERGETFSVTLASVSPTEHYLILVYHHIIMDGMSLSIFLHDLAKAYGAENIGAPPSQAIDISQSQQANCNVQTKERELQYWKSELHGAPVSLPLLSFAKARHRVPLGAYASHWFEMKLDRMFLQRLQRLCSRSGQQVTPFHFYLASWAAFLSRWLSCSDLSIGMADANREDISAIGFFLNILPVRFQMDGSDTLDRLLSVARSKVNSALAHSATPFEDIVDQLDIPRDNSYHPLVQTAINCRKVGKGSVTEKWDDNTSVEWTDIVVARSAFDIYLDVAAVADEEVWIKIAMQEHLYTPEDAEMLCKSFVDALDVLVTPDRGNLLVRDLPLASDARRQEALDLSRGPDVTWSDGWPATLVHRVDEICGRYSHDVAIKEVTGSDLTYQTMLGRVHWIANALHLKGVCSGTMVAVYMAASADALCSMLAIMRLGGIYVPLDRRNHRERLALIVQDSRPRVMIHREEDNQQAGQLASQEDGCVLFSLDAFPTASSQCRTAQSAISVASEPDKEAMLIYTSGSTGRPKGVCVTHRNLLNQVATVGRVLGTNRETVLQQSSLGFDCSTEQIFAAVAYGGTVVIAPESARGDAAALAAILLKERVTYTVGVPSEYAALLRYGVSQLKQCRDWRIAVAGGERLTGNHVAMFRALGLPALQVINAYGPAEGTVSCTRGVVTEVQGDPHVGCAMPNYTVVLLDHHLDPVPVGFPGEICIGGPGVTAGYLGRPEETQARYLESPTFSHKFNWSNAALRLYRTGDMGRMMPDGTLRYLGRVVGDSQVQILGQRVELDELAEVVVRTAGPDIIADAAVSLREDKQLVAFVLFSAMANVDKDMFLDELASRLPLPLSMRPSLMLPVDKIPLTENGKRDRRAIDAIPVVDPSTLCNHRDRLAGNSRALTDWEMQISAAWEEVLPLSMSLIKSPKADFFRTGGNSLLLLRLQSVLRTTLGVDIALPELFRNSTLEDMAIATGGATSRGRSSSQVGIAVDWDSEIGSLTDGIAAIASSPTSVASLPVRKTSGTEILLTGATGFLGTHILSKLIADPQVAKIHCIAIRPGSTLSPRCTLHPDSSKVIQYAGDLSSRSLGLSPAESAQLAASVDLIVHNGASVSFMKPYSALRRSNVVSTRALVRIALTRNIPVHFVSTAAVTNLAQRADPVPPTILADHQPDPDTDGYTASKWASETLLARCAVEHASFKAVIHRPTAILGEDMPDRDWIANLIRYSNLLQAAPRLGQSVTGDLNFIDVRRVAADIAQSAVESLTWETHTGVLKVLHHCNDEGIAPKGLSEHLRELYGKDIRECEPLEWLEEARRAGMNDLVFSFFQTWLTRSKPMQLPRITRN